VAHETRQCGIVERDGIMLLDDKAARRDGVVAADSIISR